MKNLKTLHHLITFAAMVEGMGMGPGDEMEQIRRNERSIDEIKSEQDINRENALLKKGFKKFEFKEGYVLARNEKSAIKKAKEKGIL